MLKFFAVRDSKAKAFRAPIYCASSGIALRMFVAACNDAQSDFYRFADDFKLFELGEWDPDTGVHTVLEDRVDMGAASEYRDDASRVSELEARLVEMVNKYPALFKGAK